VLASGYRTSGGEESCVRLGSCIAACYRVNGLLQYSDGFRGLKNYNYEFRSEWSWTKDNHFVVLALDVRHIERTPHTTYDFNIAEFMDSGPARACPITA